MQQRRTTMKRLPVDLQSFGAINEYNCLYVDKTMYIQKMLDQGIYFFISRARRFGKSLMVSVLKCFFENKKELFNNLWIAKHSKWKWEKYPIIQLDFNVIGHDTEAELKNSLEYHLGKTGKNNNILLKGPALKDKFEELILALHKKTGKPVVILIDEYDKPIITHLGRGDKALEIAKANRDLLKSFFGVLKGADTAPCTRFVFITGVSKFSRVSIFSDLNNLIDLTMNENFADMLGYTHEELETCFNEHIKKLAQETGKSESSTLNALKKYYDGYRFSERNIRVYNPFSVLRALHNLKFKNFWFETGTPTFLINLLKNSDFYLPSIENIKVGEQIFSTYELESLNPEALLFQTGYITIKNVKGRIYTLAYPNYEVKISFLESLLYSFAPRNRKGSLSQFLFLAEYLEQENLDDFFETINAIFASISYTLKIKKNEAYFHTLFYLMVSASGMNVSSEVITSKGRIDLVVEFEEKIYIIEFKCNQSAKAGIKQIKNKGYAEKYGQTNKKLILMGINFRSENKNIEQWEIEN